MEALKRELTDDSRDRAILRDRLADKGPAPAAPVSKTREVDYVGFANLPNQVYRRAVKKGFEFTLMVVGESGLGKSTLINSMFLSDIYSPDYPGPSHRIKKTVQVISLKTFHLLVFTKPLLITTHACLLLLFLLKTMNSECL